MTRTKLKSRCKLSFATWNVRTLVENFGGDRRICRSRPKTGLGSQLPTDPHNVDRKLDFLVKELKRMDVAIAGIQETKWFGKDVWNADGFTLLHSGRPTPDESKPQARNEGVGIVLNERATAAWKEAGEKWEAVSSRVVTARLKIVRCGQRRPGGSRETRSTYLSVVSVYAPTAKAPPGVKDKFIEELQDVLDCVPPNDILVVLGDFNPRVGKREEGRDVWRQVRGKHGLGSCNEAGERLLEFCVVNNLTIMNTWFEKREVHLATWKHPATKQSHMIDFVMMRRDQRRFCSDVRVYRSACCWTDHYMVKGEIQLQLPRKKNRCKTSVPLAVHLLRSKERKEEFQHNMSQNLQQDPHEDCGTLEGKWEKLKGCIMKTAEESFCRERKKQPDWFTEAIDELMPLISAKRQAHCTFLQTPTTAMKKEFRKHQRIVKKAVDEAKEAWIRSVVAEVDGMRKDGKVKWMSIRKLQMVHAGRKPTRTTRLYKKDGGLTNGTEEVKTTWHEHFSQVLYINSQYHQEVLDEMPALPPYTDLDHAPTFEELIEALDKLRRGKAGGKTGVLPELLLDGGAELQDRLLLLLEEVWNERTMVQDWKDAVIVPIPKKGDLRKCDNWRGISLLDVVRKVFARIMLDRLQVVAENVLPDSQCGFRKGRGCVDMVFTAKQLTEKSREHNSSLFILFVDLKKAYDSVPRRALWCVLEKHGVPPVMLSLIRSLHDGMKAVVRVSASTTDHIEVTNGLRQGCTIAPTLFNLYFSAMVTSWRVKCPLAGVTVRYRIGRKLVGDRTAKARLQEVRVTESKFADDVAVYATTREALEQAAGEFVKTAAEWGLTVSLEKTKLITMGKELGHEDSLPVKLAAGEIATVEDFTYLGSNISRDGDVKSEVVTRLGKASRAFGCLRAAVFQNSQLSTDIKREVYRAVVLSTLYCMVQKPGQ